MPSRGRARVSSKRIRYRYCVIAGIRSTRSDVHRLCRLHADSVITLAATEHPVPLDPSRRHCETAPLLVNALFTGGPTGSARGWWPRPSSRHPAASRMPALVTSPSGDEDPEGRPIAVKGRGAQAVPAPANTCGDRLNATLVRVICVPTIAAATSAFRPTMALCSNRCSAFVS